jgi:hypothetical protein
VAAGNWFGHLASRVVGEDVYAQTLSGTGKFATPEWEKAFGYIKQLADAKCVNDSANAIDDNAGAQLFFQGKAAMHPIGSWLVSWAIDEAPDLDFDYVNLPAMPSESKGNQDSVIGVATGYVVNAKSPEAEGGRRVHGAPEQPRERPEAHRGRGDAARDLRVRGPGDRQPLRVAELDAQQRAGRRAAARHRLRAQDRDAFYPAVAAVLGGQATPRTPRRDRPQARPLGRRMPSRMTGRRRSHSRSPAAPPRSTDEAARAITPWLFLAPALARVRVRGAAADGASPSATASPSGTASGR